MYQESKIELAILTHDSVFEESFEKSINFPVLKLLKGSKSTISTRLAYTPKNKNIIKSIIRKLSPERIFLNTSIDLLFQTYLATNQRIKTGYNVFLNKPKNYFYQMTDSIVSKLAVDKILAHTDYQKNRYMNIDIPEDKIKVIPHCIDIRRIQNSLKSEIDINQYFDFIQSKNPIILYVGKLEPHKGIIELVRAYEYLIDNIPITLILRGDGTLKRWILKQKIKMKNRHKDSKIIILPKLSSTMLFNLMNKASIFVLPSHKEMFGMVLLEAMALKKPIITTSSGGPPEIITNHVDGILINPYDAYELSNAILTLLNNRKMRDRIGINALINAQRRFDVSKIAPQFIEFME